MRIHKFALCRGALVGAALLAFCCVRGEAQTNAAQSNAEQKTRTPARVTDTVDETNRIVMRGNVHPLARPEFDQGSVADSQQVTRALVLLQRSAEQEQALRQLLDDQQNKTSPNFHAWLTPEQFGAQFGPADADIRAVTDWLASHGFQNLKVGAGRTAIEFSGNAGQIRNAFRTEIRRYVVGEKEQFANASEPQVPAALAPVLRGIVGLNNFKPRAQFHRVGTFRRDKTTGRVSPLFTFTPSGGSSLFAIGPTDFATIYNVRANVPTAAGLQSAGLNQSIALVEDSNVNPQDYADYRNLFGMPTSPALQIIVNGPDPGLNGDEVEADLDAQVAGAVAPNAQIIMVVTEQPQSGVGASGTDLSALYIIDNNLAPVMSESFGSCEASLTPAGNAFENALWEQAAAQGITVTVAAGDNGSAGCDPSTSNLDVAAAGLAVSGTASTPFNIAVGGTDFNSSLPNYATTYWSPNNGGTKGSAKSYIPEITWNDSCALSGSTTGCTSTIINKNASTGSDLAAGSGGPSGIYAKPTWQSGAGVPADGVRDIPDVSLFASNGQNNSFYIVCQRDANTGTGSNTNSCDLNSPFNDFQGIGGTSASSPAFAAIMALVNQKTGQRQGVANYSLYAMANKPGATCTSNAATAASPGSCIFYDIPAGGANNSVACVGGSPHCSNTSTAANQYGIMVTTGTTPAYSTGAGYDLATGLGSVNVTNLVTNWTTASFNPTKTTLTLNGATAVNITHGAAVPVNIAVAPASGTGAPTGVVELVQGSATGPVIDTFTLTNGSFSGSTTMLPGTNGTGYSVIAHYGGDGTFAASDSTAVLVNAVGKENSAVAVNLITFNANNNPSLSNSTSLPYGSAYVLRVDVTNGTGTSCARSTTPIPCPTGTVTLNDNGSALNDFLVPNTSTATNSAHLNNAGFAEDQPIQLAVGSHTITASYSGDNSYNANSSSARPLTITQATTSTSLAPPSPASIVSGGNVTLTATVGTTSNGAGPTGTVQFKNGSSNLGVAATCTPTAATASTSGTAFCTATLTTALSQFVPLGSPQPRLQIPPVLLWIGAILALLIWALAQHAAPLQGNWPRLGNRLGYAAAGLLLFACLAAGFAGCSGNKNSSGSGSSHTDSIAAVYSGDANYTTSTSTAVSVTIQ